MPDRPTTFHRDSLYIDGAWTPGDSRPVEVVDPTTEEVTGSAPFGTPADVRRAVDAARQAFDHGPWPRLSVAERAAALSRLAAVYTERKEEMAQLLSAEMGSPISYSRAVQCANGLVGLFASLAESFPFEEERPGPFGPSLVIREPVGVVGAITPWNFPQSTIAMKVAPALLAGCTVVLKPAPETPLDALLFAEFCDIAGIPPGVVNVVPGGRDAGEALVADPRIDKIGFTGSTEAGRTIASSCGHDLKRVTLELGGKSAAIVLDDADLDTLITALPQVMWANSGQVCTAQTRLLVPSHRYDEIVDAVVASAREVTVGDPRDEQTLMGPLVSDTHRSRVLSYIEAGLAEGAKLATGGGRPAGLERGWFVEPTVFTDVESSMRIAQEEIFGPVLSVLRYTDEDEALRIANDSRFGLSGSVWTADVDHGVRVARAVRTGTFRVNGAWGSPLAPFGGFKDSGLGRELGPEGIEAFVEVKAVGLPPAA